MILWIQFKPNFDFYMFIMLLYYYIIKLGNELKKLIIKKS